METCNCFDLKNELARIKAAKDSIKEALEDKGALVPDDLLIDDYADIIKSLNTGGGSSEPDEPTINYDALTFVYTENSDDTVTPGITLVARKANSKKDKYLEYNLNDTGWQTYTVNTKIPMTNISDYVKFRCNNVGSCSTLYFITDGIYECHGPVISLNNYDTVLILESLFKQLLSDTNITTAPEIDSLDISVSCFEGMFEGCKLLKEAPELPEGYLQEYCYYEMFAGCTSLTTAPVIKSLETKAACCSYMFSDCTSLTTVPELPTISDDAEYCFESMFDGCKALTNVADIKSSVSFLLPEGCCSYMFWGCTSLVYPPKIPLEIPQYASFNGTFENCTSLLYPPKLYLGYVVNNSSYASMFQDCTSLLYPPKLTATVLADSCYQNMFYRCTSLTTAPELPATKLYLNCYSAMFYGCTSLTTAPKLPALTAQIDCYTSMFENCTGLKGAIYCNLLYYENTNTLLSSITNATNMVSDKWLKNVPTLTFYKNPQRTITTRSTSSVPSGWTILNWTT